MINKPFQIDLLPKWFFETATNEQKAVLEEIANSTHKNVVVEALAGSGKTTLLKLILNILPKNRKVLFTAFSNEVVGSFKKNAPETHTKLVIQGIHSLSLAAIQDNMEDHLIYNKMTSDLNLVREIKAAMLGKEYIDPNKYQKILSKEWSEWMRAELSSGVSDDNLNLTKVQRNIKKLVDMGRLYCMTKEDQLEQLANSLGIPLYGQGKGRETVLARHVILLGLGREDLRALKTIDFIDMLWFPYALGRVGEHRAERKLPYYSWVYPFYDWVLVDECQDLSAIQLDLIRRLNPQHLVAVGDPNQAIFGFAGSDYMSFSNIQNLPGTLTLPLTVNFRSTKNIGDEVRKIVPAFATSPSCDEGSSIRNSSFEDIQKGDCIIARNNKALVELYFTLLKISIQPGQDPIPAFIKGSVVDKADEALAGEASWRAKTKSTPLVVKELRKMADDAVWAMKKRGMDQIDAEGSEEYKKLTMLADTLEVIHLMEPTKALWYDKGLAILKSLSHTNIEDAVCLCTAHRSKGLEFDRVHIYGKEDFMKLDKCDTKDQALQEKNLYYVALSRAKEELMFLKPINEWPQSIVDEQVEHKTRKSSQKTLDSII